MNWSPDDTPETPCPLCTHMKMQLLEVSLQLEVATQMLSHQVDLLRDFEQAADAATKYLEALGLNEKEKEEED